MRKNLFRKTTCGLVVLAMCVVASGCSSSDSSSSDSTDGDTNSSDALKVAFVSVQSFGDQGPADDMKAALERAEADFGVEIATYEALQADQYEEALRNFAQNDYDMIVTAFPGMAQPIAAVAEDFSDIDFVHIYNSDAYEFDNVISIDFATWEANYVCGVAAALASDADIIGHIVGGEDNTIAANYNALVKGAQTINPDVSVERINAGTFDDPAKGKEIALSLYSKGAQVIIGDAAKTTLGMIEAAQETDSFIIGDASDHSALAPGNVFMDTQIGFGNMVYAQIENMVNDTFDGGLIMADYSNDGIGTYKNTTLSDNMANQDNATRIADLWAEIDAVEAQIKSGELVIDKDISK